jgi:hypothetical protein
MGAPMTKEQLLAVIDDMRAHIAVGDSWEGFLAWRLPDPIDPPNIVAQVDARYRIGNIDGSQGGMRIVGLPQ